MIFRKRIKIPQDLIAKYRNALVAGKLNAEDEDRALFEIHLEALTELERALESKENVEEVAVKIWRERRSHGWSYLTGPEGGLATSLFHELATLAEKQIFKIKGKEWYYSL